MEPCGTTQLSADEDAAQLAVPLWAADHMPAKPILAVLQVCNEDTAAGQLPQGATHKADAGPGRGLWYSWVRTLFTWRLPVRDLPDTPHSAEHRQQHLQRPSCIATLHWNPRALVDQLV